MKLKHLIIFNLVFSTVVILYFYFYLDSLIHKSVPIHLAIVGYGLFFVYLCGLFFTRFLPKIIAGILTITLIIAGQLFLFLMYAGYYFGIKIWGYPLTYDVAKIYLFEIKNLSGKMPLPDSVVILILISVLLFTIATNVAASRNILTGLKQKSTGFFSRKNIFVVTVLFLVIPTLFFTFKPLQQKLNYNDPVLSFFLYNYSDGHTLTYAGWDRAEDQKTYPENLNFDKKNVILIVCDALRSDHLDFYGYHRNTSPFLDSVLKTENAVKMEHFYSTSSQSIIGISNLLSSNYSITTNNFFLHDLLRKQGYRVHFILSGDHTNFYGLKKHYGKNIDLFYDGVSALENNPEASVNSDKDVILDKLAALQDFDCTPAFFYFHYMSAHNGGSYDTSYNHFNPSIYKAFSKNTHAELLINDYDNRIVQLNDYLKKSLALLKQKGYLENAIVALTADHGQGLNEFGKVGHVQSIYPNEVTIPFILFDTGQNSGINKVTRAFGNQLDVAPTIVDLLGIPAPKTWNGHSVFEETGAEYIFQQERTFYGCVWHDRNGFFQFVYNSEDKSKQVFNVGLTEIQNTNIINQIDAEKLIMAEEKLKGFYKIEIP